FSLPTGLASASFTVNAAITASDADFGSQAALSLYAAAHTASSGNVDFSKVDLAFYYSDCGDNVVDSPEQCDHGSLGKGPAASCSPPVPPSNTNGTAGPAGGHGCPRALCNGASATCQHAAGNGARTCRSSTGTCDGAETCTGTSTACPADTNFASSTV